MTLPKIETITDIQQGSEKWLEIRRGIPTASNFGRVMKAKSGEPSQSQHGYILDLLKETYRQEETNTTAAMVHGNQMEPVAREWYENQTGREVHEVTFIRDWLATYGGSPDGLIDDDGGLEIKCPHSQEIHAKYVKAGVVPAQYKAQVFGLLWLTGRQWWDFVSYRNNSDYLMVRTYQDDGDFAKWRASWEKVFPKFLKQLSAAKEFAASLKPPPEPERVEAAWAWLGGQQ